MTPGDKKYKAGAHPNSIAALNRINKEKAKHAKKPEKPVPGSETKTSYDTNKGLSGVRYIIHT